MDGTSSPATDPVAAVDVGWPNDPMPMAQSDDQMAHGPMTTWPNGQMETGPSWAQCGVGYFSTFSRTNISNRENANLPETSSMTFTWQV